VKLAIVGCGYVADFYLRTLAFHPELELVAVCDRDPARAKTVADRYGARCYDDLDALLGDRDVQLVVNLTNPSSHYEVSRTCLDAGRHVYSEKPLAMTLPEARELMTLAERRGLILGTAPCNVLGESAQTVLQQLRAGTLGTVRAVHAEMDDGAVYLKDYWLWRNSLGVPWPFRDEFDVGCVMEHAAYYLTWLVAFWGPVASITAFSECLVPSKSASRSSDYAVGVLRFANGVVARLTCSIIAPENRGLLVIGEDGQLSVSDCWQYDSEVRVRGAMTMPRLRRWIEDHRGELGGSEQELASALSMLEPRTATDDLGAKLALRRVMKRVAEAETELTSDRAIPLVRPAIATGLDNNMDFSRGVAECADAALHRRQCRLSGEFALHVLECTLALRDGGTTALETSCGAFEPMPWAR
jgi:predicted dehydrogenase